jgi:hypothetical protein
MDIKLTKANALSSGTVLVSKVTPAFKGDGNVNYICAGCHAVIAENAHSGQFSSLCVECPKCGTTSAFPNVT